MVLQKQQQLLLSQGGGLESDLTLLLQIQKGYNTF